MSFPDGHLHVTLTNKGGPIAWPFIWQPAPGQTWDAGILGPTSPFPGRDVRVNSVHFDSPTHCWVEVEPVA